MPKRNAGNRYALILERIFQQKYHKGDSEIRFLRSEMVDMAKELSVDLPKRALGESHRRDGVGQQSWPTTRHAREKPASRRRGRAYSGGALGLPLPRE